MSVERSGSAGRAVFLSYASQDAEAARRVADALRLAGIEVWFDQSELVGGDAWDAKIRKQIKECALFVPIISANTQARREGYFRLEWRQADQRTHLMSHDRAFLVPVVVDDTNEQNARVPESFLAVQWTRLPGGEATSQFCERVRALLESGSGVSPGIAEHGRPGPAQGSEPVEGDARAMPESGTLALAARRARGRRLPLLFAVAALIGGSAALWQWQVEDPGAEQPEVRHFAVQQSAATAKAATARTPLDFASAKSVAVLAFANLSDDKENEYFSDGISEELLNVLAKVPGLRVAARTSAFYFKGKNTTAQEIGRKLGVAHLVDGSVRRAGTRVRIAARLSKVETGEQVWGETYEKELKDIFALQDEIAALIAKSLELKLGGVPRVTNTVNPEAHRLVLEGRHFWNLRNEEGFTKAEDAFKRALAIVHDFAAAHAGLAEVYAMRASYRAASGLAGVQTVRVEAERQARRALELDANLSEAHAVLGNVYGHEGKFAEAEKAFERAFATNPNNATARFWHAATLGEQGRLDLYLAEMQIAVAMDPLSFSAPGRLGNVLYWAQRHHDALAASDRAIALESGMFMSNRGSRAKILLALGRREEAVAAARLVRNSSSGTYRLNSDAAAIWVLRQCGHVEEATNYAGDVLALPTSNTFVRSHVLAAMGRFDEAVPLVTGSEGVERAMVLFWDPKWDPIRDDLRFHDAIAKLNRTKEYKVARETLARMLREEAKK